MSAPQSQLPAEPLLRKKDCNLPKKIFYIQNKEESTMTSILQRDRKEETPLVIQRLRPCSPNAGGPDSIPSQGTKVLHAKKIGKKKKKRRNRNETHNPSKRQKGRQKTQRQRPETAEGAQKRDVATS